MRIESLICAKVGSDVLTMVGVMKLLRCTGILKGILPEIIDYFIANTDTNIIPGVPFTMPDQTVLLFVLVLRCRREGAGGSGLRVP